MAEIHSARHRVLRNLVLRDGAVRDLAKGMGQYGTQSSEGPGVEVWGSKGHGIEALNSTEPSMKQQSMQQRGGLVQLAREGQAPRRRAGGGGTGIIVGERGKSQAACPPLLASPLSATLMLPSSLPRRFGLAGGGRGEEDMNFKQPSNN